MRADLTTLSVFLFFSFFVKHTHKQIILGKGDETREYTHKPRTKLHAAHSVALQVINLFSISDIADVGQLNNTHIHTYV